VPSDELSAAHGEEKQAFDTPFIIVVVAHRDSVDMTRVTSWWCILLAMPRWASTSVSSLEQVGCSRSSAERDRASLQVPHSKSSMLNKISPTCTILVASVIMALPAHHPPPADETDDELSDAQIDQLLKEAERSLRAKQQAKQHALRPDAPFRLPKLNPGIIAETSLKTEGSITRVDPSKLINSQQRALAEGSKKIEDPVQVKKQKLAVCPCSLSPSLPRR
jgi:hypothetical protein